jgi:hypothetical protein
MKVGGNAKGMRALEAKQNINRTEFLPNMGRCRNLAEQEARGFTTADLSRMHNEYQNEFRCRYLPEAQALERELCKRLGRSIIANNYRVIALREGILAGPSPVSDAADYLEEMAREL